jgi:hypothetical protein
VYMFVFCTRNGPCDLVENVSTNISKYRRVSRMIYLSTAMSIPHPEILQMPIADGEVDEETQVVEEGSAINDREERDGEASQGIEEGNPEDINGAGARNAGALDDGGDGGEHMKKKREPEEGKSLLPFTRVQKIMRADRARPSRFTCFR